MFFTLVPFQVDIFFAISGLLLSLQFIKYTQTRRFSWTPFWMGLANRYLRSLPVYSVLMLFTVSVYDRIPVSPSAYRVIPTVRRICRDKWWTNLLFINNYYQPEEQVSEGGPTLFSENFTMMDDLFLVLDSYVVPGSGFPVVHRRVRLAYGAVEVSTFPNWLRGHRMIYSKNFQ